MTGPVSSRGSSSTQRTHRYLRLAIGGTVVVVLGAMAGYMEGAGLGCVEALRIVYRCYR